ncbi:MAG: hypothetical protein K9I68_03690 [Bacteroidales bacterium]|nr:hypothetical protein [Bacteroidales bacterium]MCF8337635.1 hypothetical protein [Bacteroidales bacterium]
MKNFPHQINDLEKLFNALTIIKEMQLSNIVLTDENFGIRLARAEIYTYRDNQLSIEEYLKFENQKPVSKRGYLTAARDIKRLFQLLEFIYLSPNKEISLSTSALQLLSTESEDLRKILWKDAFFSLGLEGTDGEISHPYRILIKLVQDFPGIDSNKLLLALEPENDSNAEYERILSLVSLDLDEIIKNIGTTKSMAKNAVKILPTVAVQVGDVIRSKHKVYPITNEIITEDEISSIESKEVEREKPDYRETSTDNIATNPNLSEVTNTNIDLTSAIRIRQQRLVEHQEIVRKLAFLNDKLGYTLYEGKFDCFSINDNKALLYEVKTLKDSFTDEEKQSIKGVGQVKYYNFSIVREKMGFQDIENYLVFSRKPSDLIIRFCKYESITAVWCIGDDFFFQDDNGDDMKFIPD